MSIIGKRRDLLVSLVILIIAGVLRFWASLDDFWLDEIWSWVHVQVGVKSAWDILFTLRHDNNHILNSWWMYALGPAADRIWYRLPPVICGSMTVLLARQAAAKSGPIAVWLVTCLTLPSYFLIHYSSEARGYGYEMFFCLAAFVLLDRILEDCRSAAPVDRSSHGRDRGLFAAACVGGALSHPTFLFLFASLVLWATWVTLQQPIKLIKRVLWFLSVFAAPGIGIGFLWFVNFSRMQFGGGDPQVPWMVALETLSLMVGGPESGELSLGIGLTVVVAVIVQLIYMARTGDDRWVCAAGVIALPMALVLATGNRLMYPRYLLATVMVLLPVLAMLLSRGFEQGVAGRTVTMVIMAGTLIGNGKHLTELYRYGRGQGQDVVEFLRDHSADGPILVGSDQPFRHGLVLEYFSQRLALQDRLRHVGPPPWPPERPRWFLVHTQAREWNPPLPSSIDLQGQRYELRREFPYAGLSGWQTAIYESRSSSERGASAP